MATFATGQTDFTINIDDSQLDSALSKARALDTAISKLNRTVTVGINFQGLEKNSSRVLNKKLDIVKGMMGLDEKSVKGIVRDASSARKKIDEALLNPENQKKLDSNEKLQSAYKQRKELLDSYEKLNNLEKKASGGEIDYNKAADFVVSDLEKKLQTLDEFTNSANFTLDFEKNAQKAKKGASEYFKQLQGIYDIINSAEKNEDLSSSLNSKTISYFDFDSDFNKIKKSADYEGFIDWLNDYAANFGDIMEEARENFSSNLGKSFFDGLDIQSFNFAPENSKSILSSYFEKAVVGGGVEEIAKKKNEIKSQISQLNDEILTEEVQTLGIETNAQAINLEVNVIGADKLNEVATKVKELTGKTYEVSFKLSSSQIEKELEEIPKIITDSFSQNESTQQALKEALEKELESQSSSANAAESSNPSNKTLRVNKQTIAQLQADIQEIKNNFEDQTIWFNLKIKNDQEFISQIESLKKEKTLDFKIEGIENIKESVRLISGIKEVSTVFKDFYRALHLFNVSYVKTFGEIGQEIKEQGENGANASAADSNVDNNISLLSKRTAAQLAELNKSFSKTKNNVLHVKLELDPKAGETLREQMTGIVQSINDSENAKIKLGFDVEAIKNSFSEVITSLIGQESGLSNLGEEITKQISAGLKRLANEPAAEEPKNENLEKLYVERAKAKQELDRLIAEQESGYGGYFDNSFKGITKNYATRIKDIASAIDFKFDPTKNIEDQLSNIYKVKDALYELKTITGVINGRDSTDLKEALSDFSIPIPEFTFPDGTKVSSITGSQLQDYLGAQETYYNEFIKQYEAQLRSKKAWNKAQLKKSVKSADKQSLINEVTQRTSDGSPLGAVEWGDQINAKIKEARKKVEEYNTEIKKIKGDAAESEEPKEKSKISVDVDLVPANLDSLRSQVQSYFGAENPIAIRFEPEGLKDLVQTVSDSVKTVAETISDSLKQKIQEASQEPIIESKNAEPQIETKPVETLPVEPKPVETKPVEPKPVETKPIEMVPEKIEIKQKNNVPVDDFDGFLSTLDFTDHNKLREQFKDRIQETLSYIDFDSLGELTPETAQDSLNKLKSISGSISQLMNLYSLISDGDVLNYNKFNELKSAVFEIPEIEADWRDEGFGESIDSIEGSELSGYIKSVEALFLEAKAVLGGLTDISSLSDPSQFEDLKQRLEIAKKNILDLGQEETKPVEPKPEPATEPAPEPEPKPAEPVPVPEPEPVPVPAEIDVQTENIETAAEIKEQLNEDTSFEAHANTDELDETADKIEELAEAQKEASAKPADFQAEQTEPVLSETEPKVENVEPVPVETEPIEQIIEVKTEVETGAVEEIESEIQETKPVIPVKTETDNEGIENLKTEINETEPEINVDVEVDTEEVKSAESEIEATEPEIIIKTEVETEEIKNLESEVQETEPKIKVKTEVETEELQKVDNEVKEAVAETEEPKPIPLRFNVDPDGTLYDQVAQIFAGQKIPLYFEVNPEGTLYNQVLQAFEGQKIPLHFDSAELTTLLDSLVEKYKSGELSGGATEKTEGKSEQITGTKKTTQTSPSAQKYQNKVSVLDEKISKLNNKISNTVQDAENYTDKQLQYVIDRLIAANKGIDEDGNINTKKSAARVKSDAVAKTIAAVQALDLTNKDSEWRKLFDSDPAKYVKNGDLDIEKTAQILNDYAVKLDKKRNENSNAATMAQKISESLKKEEATRDSAQEKANAKNLKAKSLQEQLDSLIKKRQDAADRAQELAAKAEEQAAEAARQAQEAASRTEEKPSKPTGKKPANQNEEDSEESEEKPTPKYTDRFISQIQAEVDKRNADIYDLKFDSIKDTVSFKQLSENGKTITKTLKDVSQWEQDVSAAVDEMISATGTSKLTTDRDIKNAQRYREDYKKRIEEQAQIEQNRRDTADLEYMLQSSPAGEIISDAENFNKIVSIDFESDGSATIVSEFTSIDGAIEQATLKVNDYLQVLQSARETGNVDLTGALSSEATKTLDADTMIADLEKYKETIDKIKASQSSTSLLSPEDTESFRTARAEAEQLVTALENMNLTAEQASKFGGLKENLFGQFSDKQAVALSTMLTQYEKLITLVNGTNNAEDFQPFKLADGTTIESLDQLRTRLEAVKQAITEIMLLGNNGTITGDAIKQLKTELDGLLTFGKDAYRQETNKGSLLGYINDDTFKNLEKRKSAVEDLVDSMNRLNNVDSRKYKNRSQTNNSDAGEYYVGNTRKRFRVRYDKLDDGTYAARYMEEESRDIDSGLSRWVTAAKNKFVSLTQYFTGMMFAQRIFSEIKQGFSFVTELNTALSNINMTMGATKSELNQLGKQAIQTGVDLSTDASEVLSAVTVYANANETADSILEKAKPTIMLANASQVDASTAADQIQAVIQQFSELEGQERRIVSSYEKISAGLAMDFASGISTMSDAVQNAGTVASESGLSFETFAAITGKVAEKTRNDGSSIGNTLKTSANC